MQHWDGTEGVSLPGHVYTEYDDGDEAEEQEGLQALAGFWPEQNEGPHSRYEFYRFDVTHALDVQDSDIGEEEAYQ